jgi:hypothetical protein
MSILNVYDVVVVVDGKRGALLNLWSIQIGIAQSIKSDVDFGCTGGKFGGEDSKWKFTTSCFHVSYVLVFAYLERRNYSKMPTQQYLKRELTSSVSFVSVVAPNIADRMVLLSKAHLREGPLLELGECLTRLINYYHGRKHMCSCSFCILFT